VRQQEAYRQTRVVQSMM